MRRNPVCGWLSFPATSASDLLLLDSFVVVVYVLNATSNVIQKVSGAVKSGGTIRRIIPRRYQIKRLFVSRVVQKFG